jgi:ribosomal protein S18 acetylase RimI-like enzyme
MDFREVEFNLRESFRLLASARTATDISELPGVSIASAGVTFQMFNAAFLSGPVTTPEEMELRVATAHRHFRSRGEAWAFWFCEGWMERGARRRLAQVCSRYGLRPAADMPGMVAETLAASKRRLPPLDFARVDGVRTLEDFRCIGATCFHVPVPWFAEVFDPAMLTERGAMVCWVAYQDGTPVGTAATLRTNGVTGLYNVATLPEFRGRGVAEAITRHAVAAAGPAPVILQSSSMGVELYERLGFREVTRIEVYNSEAR